jgi:hypothetical protein
MLKDEKGLFREVSSVDPLMKWSFVSYPPFLSIAKNTNTPGFRRFRQQIAFFKYILPHLDETPFF